jgi:hypothetical protein
MRKHYSHHEKKAGFLDESHFIALFLAIGNAGLYKIDHERR